MRIECTPAERGIWVDLLSLASKDDGHIRANEDTPYPLQQLSGMLLIPEDELEAAIQKFIKTKKLIKEKTGTLYIATWDKYQFTDRHKRRILDSQGDYFSPKYETFAPCPEKYKSMATKKGLVRVSRLIVAIAINRSLKPAEQVHHIDGNDKNDTVENLMLFKGQREHLRYQHGYEAECIWRGDYLGSDEIKAISVKIKDAILYNNKLNNNKLNNIKHTCPPKKNPKKPKKPKKLETVTFIRKGKEITVSIDEAFYDYWYKDYPLKVNPKVALPKFRARCRQGQFEEIDLALTGYLNHIKNECLRRGIEFKKMKPYILYPQTFLEKERWKEFIGVKHVADL